MEDKLAELVTAYGFMLFGLFFLIYVLTLVTRDEEARYARKLNEAREFGLGPRVRRHFSPRRR